MVVALQQRLKESSARVQRYAGGYAVALPAPQAAWVGGSSEGSADSSSAGSSQFGGGGTSSRAMQVREPVTEGSAGELEEQGMPGPQAKGQALPSQAFHEEAEPSAAGEHGGEAPHSNTQWN